MEEELNIKVIAHIYNSFNTKFGIPRQSGLADNKSESIIVFEEEYRDENALRGIQDYSHLWLIWHFSENKTAKWKPTVRPPRLGGNKRMGVFATRSPFRPNPIGLSSVKLLGIGKNEKNGMFLKVGSCDLMNGTPILDIKPYLTFTDCHTDAKCGFASEVFEKEVFVDFSEQAENVLSTSEKSELSSLLSQDPRPSYQDDKDRIYGMSFGKYDIKFKVENNILTVVEITNQQT